MRYALLMYADPAHTQAMSKSAVQRVMSKHAAWVKKLTASGELTGGAGLALPRETTVLRLSPDGVTADP